MRRNRKGSAVVKEGGGYWQSYSDLMAALLLLIILVLFCSAYLYKDMEEYTTAELARRSGLLDEQKSIVASQEGKLTEQEKAMIAQSAKLLLQEQQIKEAEALLSIQREQFESAQALLIDQQVQMSEQRNLLDEQQNKLDALVGIKTNIILDLNNALKGASLNVNIDAQTGAIKFDSGVFFDVGQSTLKQTGKDYLNSFLPIYMQVLLDGKNKSYLSEIIIEGHTDTTGGYETNLQLSQQRALAVSLYVMSEENKALSTEHKDHLRTIMTTNGRSWSNPIKYEDGSVNMEASRRVEFKFRMKDEDMITEMRRLLGEM